MSRVHELVAELQVIREQVRRRLKMVQAKQRHDYNKKRVPVRFDPGELVFIYKPVRKKGRSSKLMMCYWGPFRIVKRLSDLNYLVKGARRGARYTDVVHVARLKRFYQREEK